MPSAVLIFLFLDFCTIGIGMVMPINLEVEFKIGGREVKRWCILKCLILWFLSSRGRSFPKVKKPKTNLFTAKNSKNQKRLLLQTTKSNRTK